MVLRGLQNISKGLTDSLTSSIGGTFSDQWKDIITAGKFNEQMVFAPGIYQEQNNGRGVNTNGSAGVISHGSVLRVPENTAAVIFSQSGIEQMITEAGEFVYDEGEVSIFHGDDVVNSARAVLNNIGERFKFGGQASVEKYIGFVNLREIRGMKFGTPGPLMYNDKFYGVDLEILARGAFSIQITNPEVFILNFLPPNVKFYSFSDAKATNHIKSEFLQSFMDAINSLSKTHRISELPSKSNEISEIVVNDAKNAGSWEERFGFKIVSVALETIEFSPESKELVRQYTKNKMNLSAYDNVSQKSANIAVQQKIAQGIEKNGLGDGAGMMFGMNMAQNLNPQTAQISQSTTTISFDEQIETLKKLKNLLDSEIITQEEFEAKKREVMGL